MSKTKRVIIAGFVIALILSAITMITTILGFNDIPLYGRIMNMISIVIAITGLQLLVK